MSTLALMQCGTFLPAVPQTGVVTLRFNKEAFAGAQAQVLPAAV